MTYIGSINDRVIGKYYLYYKAGKLSKYVALSKWEGIFTEVHTFVGITYNPTFRIIKTMKECPFEHHVYFILFELDDAEVYSLISLPLILENL